MAADNFIVRHWKIEKKIFDRNLLLLREQLTADAIHDLRVAVKKLRSYIKLYSVICNGKTVDEHFEKTKLLFSVLGKHRNIEIVKNLLPSVTPKTKTIPQSLLVYLELLQEQVAPYCKQTVLEYSTAGLDELTGQLEKDTQALSIDEMARKVRDNVISSFKNIEGNLKHFQKKSHLIRKRLKDIYYWLKILPEGFGFAKPEVKVIDRILDYLGSIQDYEVLASNVKGFRKMILPKTQTDYDLAKEIEARAKKKKDGFLKKAHSMTEELVSKIGDRKNAV